MSVAASKAPLARARTRRLPGRRGGDSAERNGHEARGADPLEQARAAELRRADSECDEQDRHGADARSQHEEAPAAEPVGVAREDGCEYHLGDRLGAADEPDGEAVRLSVGEIAQPELHGDADTNRADAEQSARDQERSDGQAGDGPEAPRHQVASSAPATSRSVTRQG